MCFAFVLGDWKLGLAFFETSEDIATEYCEEEVETSAVVKRRILEDKSTEISVSSDNVVCLFFLSKLIPIILRFIFCCLSD